MATDLILLIGYRATGKTTVAEHLAGQLGVSWWDADVLLEQRAGKTIAEIFAAAGESAFRELEVEIVSQLCQRRQGVVALGGGAVLREENRRAIADSGASVVWLKADAPTIEARIRDDPTSTQRRPNLTNRAGRDEIESLLSARDGFYRQCATLVVDTEGKAPHEIADEILRQLA